MTGWHETNTQLSWMQIKLNAKNIQIEIDFIEMEWFKFELFHF